MMNSLNFKDKQILITGAAIGIGKETAVLISKLGARVILLDINEEKLVEASSCMEGNGHLYINFDLRDLNGIESKINGLVASCGPFDGFVHCVGIRCRRPLPMIKPDVLCEVLNLNFGSFFELVRCITKKNHFNKGLSIVGVSSISSQRGSASVSAYAASKAAMDCSVRCLAKELAVKKIRLNTVVPGQIKTPAYDSFIKMKGGAEDAILSHQYLGLGEPADVANVIVFLLSNSSKFITGSAIPIDGGFLST